MNELVVAFMLRLPLPPHRSLCIRHESKLVNSLGGIYLLHRNYSTNAELLTELKKSLKRMRKMNINATNPIIRILMT